MAVQALVILARSEGVCPSQTIAGDLQAHAVFMRRVLSQLGRAGIVAAREGRDGGYRLSRLADGITLAEVYRAVKAAAAIDLAMPEADHNCAGTAAMRAAFEEIAAETDDAVLAVLERHTIGELVERTGTLSAGA